MNLVVNGKNYDLDVETLADVVSHFQVDPRLIVTEVDGDIIDETKWKETKMTDGMTIELVHFVGGG